MPVSKNTIFKYQICYPQMWLPPTPPSDDCYDYYVDFALDMTYDTLSVMTPVALVSSAVYR